MKTNQNEFLSAVLDDEAGEFERRRLLDELRDNAELGQTLNRYSLVGEAMRSQQRTITDSGDFLSGIQAQLTDEPVYDEVMVPAAQNNVVQGGNQGGQNSQRNQSAGQNVGRGQVTKQPLYRSHTGRYAIAASVAVAALAGVLLLQNNDPQPEVSATLAQAEAPVVKPVAVVDAEMTAAGETTLAASKPVTNRTRRVTLANTGMDQATANTLKQYVTLHMQYRSSNGIAPSIQAVSYAK